MDSSTRWTIAAIVLGLCTAYVIWSDRGASSVAPPAPGVSASAPATPEKQPSLQEEIRKVTGPTKLRFDPELAEFGEVPFHETRTKVLTISNPTLKPIKIEHIKPSCGCLEATLANSTIQPGQSEKLTLKFTALGGKKEQLTVGMQTNENTRTALIYPVRGKTKVEFTVEPESILIGTLERNETKTQSVTIRRHDGKPFQLISAAFRAPIKEAQLAWEPTNAEKTEYKLTANCTGVRGGMLSETITVLTDHPTTKAIPVHFAMQCKLDVTFEPGTVTGARTENDKVTPFETIVRRRSPGALEIQGVTEANGLKLNYEVKPIDQQSCKLTIRFEDAYVSRAPYGQFMIKTNTDENPAPLHYRVNTRLLTKRPGAPGTFTPTASAKAQP